MSPIERNRTADLMKGIAVIVMVQVHLMELIARQDIYNSLAGKISLFLGGPPAAPVFMAVMGYYIAISGKSARQMVIRGVKIIALGLLLNIGLNFHLLLNIYNGVFQFSALPYIFGVDILFLAGLSIVILALMKKYFGYRLLPYVLMLLFIQVLQYLLKDVYHVTTNNYLVAFFYGEGCWWSYFPVIPWISYPLTGYIFFVLQKEKYDGLRRFYPYITVFAAFMTGLFFDYGLDVSSDLDIYYHHDFVFFLYTVCFLIFWLFITNGIARLPENPVSDFLAWTGINVTAAYVVQWLVIGNIATSIYKTQSWSALVLWFIFVLMVMSGGVMLWNHIKKNRQKSRRKI
jgi:uncharacterized membrane protein